MEERLKWLVVSSRDKVQVLLTRTRRVVVVAGPITRIYSL